MDTNPTLAAGDNEKLFVADTQSVTVTLPTGLATGFRFGLSSMGPLNQAISIQINAGDVTLPTGTFTSADGTVAPTPKAIGNALELIHVGNDHWFALYVVGDWQVPP